jgi:hypothetical protein
MGHRTMLVTAAALLVTAAALAGCSDANPVAAEASVAVNGLSAGGSVEVTAALSNTVQAVKGFQAENGRYPSAAEFAGIPGAAANGGAAISYVATTGGFCLAGTSSTNPPVTRVWREPGGLQAPGSRC